MNENATSGVVTEAGQTSTGKPKLKIGGHWYYLGRGLKGAAPPLGASIELKYSLFGDKGDLRSLEAWRPEAIKQTSQGVQTNIPLSAPVDEASLRFISNVVGSAIASGAIKQPNEVASWFIAAKNALQNKEQTDDPRSHGPDFDDDIGF